MKTPKDFDLNHQWSLFCERCGIPESRMPDDQRREMKRAFFGACGQMLILMKDELGDYGDRHGDEAAASILQNMLEQVEFFWKGEITKQFPKSYQSLQISIKMNETQGMVMADRPMQPLSAETNGANYPPAPSQQARPVSIQPVNHGYVVTVGCQTFAIESVEALLHRLSLYLKDPARAEKNWLSGEWKW